jgi:hypothetical protein
VIKQSFRKQHATATSCHILTLYTTQCTAFYTSTNSQSEKLFARAFLVLVVFKTNHDFNEHEVFSICFLQCTDFLPSVIGIKRPLTDYFVFEAYYDCKTRTGQFFRTI